MGMCASGKSESPGKYCYARHLRTVFWAQVAEPSDKGLCTYLMCIHGDSLVRVSVALPLPPSGNQAPELPVGRKVKDLGKTEAGVSAVAPEPESG